MEGIRTGIGAPETSKDRLKIVGWDCDDITAEKNAKLTIEKCINAEDNLSWKKIYFTLPRLTLNKLRAQPRTATVRKPDRSFKSLALTYVGTYSVEFD